MLVNLFYLKYSWGIQFGLDLENFFKVYSLDNSVDLDPHPVIKHLPHCSELHSCFKHTAAVWQHEVLALRIYYSKPICVAIFQGILSRALFISYPRVMLRFFGGVFWQWQPSCEIVNFLRLCPNKSVLVAIPVGTGAPS